MEWRDRVVDVEPVLDKQYNSQSFMSHLLKKYRYSLILLRQLVKTDFKLRYQGSVLGYLWSLMRPLFLFLIMYFVFVYFLRIGADVPHWPVQLLLGIILWNFFAEITNTSVTSIVARGDLLRKLNFPKYVIVLSSAISAFINLLINMVVLLIFAIFNGVEFRPEMLLSGLFIIELLVFALGIGFFLSALFVRLRDVNYIWEIIMQGLFYASIVVYPITYVLAKSELLTKVLLLNPVAQVIQDVRKFLVSDDTVTLFSVMGEKWYIAIVPIILSVAVLIFGALFFKKRSGSFAEEV